MGLIILTELEETKTKKWFIYHDIVSYWKQDSLYKQLYGKEGNLIASKVRKSGVKKPLCEDFEKIRKGDIIVYYASDVGLVTGLFQIDSEIEYRKKDIYWQDEFMVFLVKPIKTSLDGKYLNLRALVEEGVKGYSFKAFSNAKELNSYSSEKICIPFDEDYELLKQALSEKKFHTDYIKKVIEPDIWAGLLDFYNSRAVSFVSMFIASLFGIVTLSAIIQYHLTSFQIIEFWNYFPLAASGILYMAFAFIGYHTLSSFFFYSGIADKIRWVGLLRPYYKEFNKNSDFKAEGEIYKIVGLADLIVGTERERSNSTSKRILKRTNVFTIFYMVSMILLAIIVYWQIVLNFYAVSLLGIEVLISVLLFILIWHRRKS